MLKCYWTSNVGMMPYFKRERQTCNIAIPMCFIIHSSLQINGYNFVRLGISVVPLDSNLSLDFLYLYQHPHPPWCPNKVFMWEWHCSQLKKAPETVYFGSYFIECQTSVNIILNILKQHSSLVENTLILPNLVTSLFCGTTSKLATVVDECAAVSFNSSQLQNGATELCNTHLVLWRI